MTDNKTMAGAGKPAQLFDLTSDIGETKNLAKERPEDAARLQALFDQWNADNIPPFFPSFREYHKQMREVYQNIPTGF